MGVRCARACAVIAALALLPPAARSAEPEAARAADAESAHAEADRLSRAGKLDEAIALAERALSADERELGPEHPRVVEATNQLGMLYLAADDYAAAEALFERVLEIATQALGPSDPEVAAATNNLGMLYWEQGDRERALEHLERALATWEAALGPDHETVAAVLHSIAPLHQSAGDAERARALYERALAIWEGSPDPPREKIAEALNALAAICEAQGDFGCAESRLKRALALAERSEDPEQFETAVALSRLAKLYLDASDYANAEPVLARVLKIAEENPGPDHLNIATAASYLAKARHELGDSAGAARLYERVYEIQSQSVRASPLDLTKTLDELAWVHRSLGEYARARELYERKLEILVKARGEGVPAVAKTRKKIAAMHWLQGDFASAERLFAKVLSARKEGKASDHPTYAHALNNLASANLMLGRYEKAKPLYEEALAVREKLLDPVHPAIARSLRNLGLTHWALGDWGRAETYLARAAELEERQISLLLPARSNERALAAMESIRESTDLILSFQRKRSDRKSTTRLALETALRRKGRELGIAADAAAAFARRLGDDERAVFERLLALRTELAESVRQESNQPRSDAARERADALRRELSDLEKKAARGSAALRSWAAPVRIEGVQSKLAAHAALVELVEYRELDPTRISADLDPGVPRLAAFVLCAAGDPRWIPLGETAPLEASIRAFREALVDTSIAERERRARARDLFDRLAAPLEPHLEGVRTVWVAPDGALVLVPFGALIDPDGRHWIERREFAYLTSGRDLLLANPPLASGGLPLVIAAPDYEAKLPERGGALDAAQRQLSAEIAGLRFEPIDVSQTGAAELGRLLGVSPLTGARASDAALRSARAPRVLHVASDAFFLPDPEGREPSARWASMLGVEARVRRPPTDNPLLRSGLAFAGANGSANGAHRGLLTALEIAGLDLWGTRLAAVAARAVEPRRAAIDRAVYAFWRSLVIAGSEAQLVNLWTADPAAATELMTAYYERLLAGEGRSEALRSVQLAMLQSESRRHPFYWAGFISLGARGPIVWVDSPETERTASRSP